MAGFGDIIKRQKPHGSQQPKEFTTPCDAEMAKESFQVYIHEGEMEQIHKWTLMKDNIETGGDLFGLWVDKHTAVVQFVLGPGEGCRRTSVSFHQNTNYLDRAGKYLVEHHGLCNIGQWHSHHSLNLRKPSGGDEHTVWGNMPGLGMDRYIVFIANIIKTKKANVNCFLFEIDNKGQRLPVLKGNFKERDGESPLRLNESIFENVIPGQEDGDKMRKLANTQNTSNRSDDSESESKRRRTEPEEDHGKHRTTPSRVVRKSSSKMSPESKQEQEDKNRQKGELIKTSNFYNKAPDQVSTTQVIGGNERTLRTPLQKQPPDGGYEFQTDINVKEQIIPSAVDNNRSVHESMRETECKEMNTTRDRPGSNYDNVKGPSNEVISRNTVDTDVVGTQPKSTSNTQEKNFHGEESKEKTDAEGKKSCWHCLWVE